MVENRCGPPISSATAILIQSTVWSRLSQPAFCATQAIRNGRGTRTALKMISGKSQEGL